VKLDVSGVITLEVTDPKGLCKIPDPAAPAGRRVPSVGPGVPGPMPPLPSPLPSIFPGVAPSPANPYQPVVPGTIQPHPGWTTPMRPRYFGDSQSALDCSWTKGLGTAMGAGVAPEPLALLPPGRGEMTARAAEFGAAQESRNGDSDQEHD